MPKKKVFHDSDSDDDDLEDTEIEPILHESDEDESDSDAAPEDITFTSSRQKALQKVRDALSQIGSQKEKLKQKRRIRNDQFKEQKENSKWPAASKYGSDYSSEISEVETDGPKTKLETLEKNRLSADVLENLKSKPIKRKKEEEEEEPVKVVKDDDGSDQADEESGMDQQYDETGDFIPLASGKEGVKAVYVMEALRATKTSAQRAADFRQQRLYGNHLARESSRDQRAKIQKRRARHK